MLLYEISYLLSNSNNVENRFFFNNNFQVALKLFKLQIYVFITGLFDIYKFQK